MKYYFFSALLFAFVICLGCGNGNLVTGVVKFEDGTPLTSGRVVFDSGSHSYSGSLNTTGQYTLLGNEGKAGIPNGTYEVYILGAERAVDDPDAPPTPLIHKDFTQKKTSNLKREVEGKTVFDITIKAP